MFIFSHMLQLYFIYIIEGIEDYTRKNIDSIKFIDMGTEHKVHKKCRMNIIIHLNKKTRIPNIRNVENLAMHVQLAEEHSSDP